MVFTIAIIVGLLIVLPALLLWLLRPRKQVTPGPFHDQLSGPGGTGGGSGAGHDAGSGH